MPTAGQTKPEEFTNNNGRNSNKQPGGQTVGQNCFGFAHNPITGVNAPSQLHRGLNWVELEVGDGAEPGASLSSSCMPHLRFQLVQSDSKIRIEIMNPNSNLTDGWTQYSNIWRKKQKKKQPNRVPCPKVVRVIEFCGASSLASIYLTTYCVYLPVELGMARMAGCWPNEAGKWEK